MAFERIFRIFTSLIFKMFLLSFYLIQSLRYCQTRHRSNLIPLMLFFENSPTIFDKDNDLVNYSETVVKHSQQIYPKTYCLSNNEGLNV